MKKKIKCHFCDEKYYEEDAFLGRCPKCGMINEETPKEDDYSKEEKCSKCGATNEETLQEENFSDKKNNDCYDEEQYYEYDKEPIPRKTVSIKTALICITFVLFAFIIFLIIGMVASENGFIEGNNGKTTYLQYSEELLTDTSVYMGLTSSNKYCDVNYDNRYEVTGSYTDILKCMDYLLPNQVSSIETHIKVKDGELTIDDKTLYIDNLDMEWHKYNGSCRITMNIELAEALSNTPSKINFYLISEDGKERLKEDEYSVSYKEGISTWKDILSKGYSGDVNMKADINELSEYTIMQVAIDNNIYEFEISFSETILVYYGMER